MPGTVYAIAGGKGGVGKTTTAANLAATFRATGRSVALVDADLAMSDLQGMVGLEQEPTVHDVLAGEASLSEALVQETDDVLDVPGRLDILPGSPDLDAFARADPDGLTDVVEELAHEYEVVVLDTASGVTKEVAVPVAAADSTVVVTTPAAAAVHDAAKTARFVEEAGGSVAGLAVSQLGPGLSEEAIAERTGLDVLTTIPDLDEPGTDPLRPYRRLVVRLLIGRDVATDPAEVLDIGEAETPRITATLEPVPEDPSETAAADDGDEETETDTDDADDPEDIEREASFEAGNPAKSRFSKFLESLGDEE